MNFGNDENQKDDGPRGLCDPETGLCELPEAGQKSVSEVGNRPSGEVLYVGDPMCSWCWGVSPGLRQLEAEANWRGLRFRVLVGGLRPGGGDLWNARFKNFLRHHWEEIGARTGQPFDLGFFDRTTFNYDTEPSCRAFYVMRGMLEELPGPTTRAYEVFAAIQRKFYAEAQDPTVASFYESICIEHGLDLPEFMNRFNHPDAQRATAREFQEVAALGVRGFPTVLFRGPDSVEMLAGGYSTGDRLVEALTRVTGQR